ncbi:MAG: hypothetical protein F4069_10510 [Rhodothermaceae bacterium]|nr:hypothetical protein [Rhodothermaceae bacterium]MYG69347.1 hypothetical protein [Rhodothermaceae bacterium]MYJ45731.1 hypothetical protein [Rhodothermaceae bacterium]
MVKLFQTTCVLILLTLNGFMALAQSSHIQAGLGGWPGAGMQFVHIQARSIYSLEVLASVDTELWKERTPVYVSAGVGAALRPLGILRVIGQANYSYDLYLGIRFGPALTFLHEQTRAEKNRQFSLFLDPFLRYTRPIGQQTAFIEIGAQRPSLRIGLWIPLD